MAPQLPRVAGDKSRQKGECPPATAMGPVGRGVASDAGAAWPSNEGDRGGVSFAPVRAALSKPAGGVIPRLLSNDGIGPKSGCDRIVADN